MPALTSKQIAENIVCRIKDDIPHQKYRHYARWKIRLDPLYPTIAQLLQGSDLEVLDVGCGMGMFAFYLRETGYDGAITGIDFDADKIAVAQEIATKYTAGPEFEVGDMRRAWPRTSGHVCLLDVLQYVPKVQRLELFKQAAERVAEGGLLIIRGAVREPTWRWRVNHFMDHVAKRLAWMKAPPVEYPSLVELEEELLALGLYLESQAPLWGRTPFNMRLLVFRRI